MKDQMLSFERAEPKHTSCICVQDRGCYTMIQGFVNGKEVISLSNNIHGQWHTSMSSCLPSNIELAKVYVDVYHQIFEHLERMKVHE